MDFIGLALTELPTPACLVDLDKVEASCRWMSETARTLEVRLRPHVKTHKCAELARLQLGAPSGPITVSTFAEAWHFADAGFQDQLLAVPLPPQRIPESRARRRLRSRHVAALSLQTAHGQIAPNRDHLDGRG